jgi:hypothetical protein
VIKVFLPVVSVGNAGSNLSPLYSLRSWPGCSRGSRIRCRINLWLFVPVIVRSSFGSLLLRTFKIVFYTDMLLIYLKTYRNIVCLKDSFVPTK